MRFLGGETVNEIKALEHLATIGTAARQLQRLDLTPTKLEEAVVLMRRVNPSVYSWLIDILRKGDGV